MGRLNLLLRGAGGSGGSPATLLAPSTQWNGTPETGFGTAKPAKPTAATRVNARPTLRPLFLEHHLVTGANDGSEILVFAADSIDPTVLTTDIDYVRVWCEGNYVDVSDRTMTTYTDLRGTTRYLIGYAVRLDWATAQGITSNGRARICAEAFSTDGTWTKQVSPERTVHFRPGSSLTAGQRYDVVKTVGASGADYTSLGAAMGYAATNNTQLVGIKIMDSGNYRPNSTVSLSVATRPVEIFANTGVTAQMGIYGTTSGSGDTSTGMDGVRFRGQGITLDTSTSANMTWAISVGSGSGDLCQFEGIEIYAGNGGGTSGYYGSGSGLLYNGDGPSQSWFGNVTSGIVQAKDCYVHDIPGYGFVSFDSVINCDISNISGSGVENVTGVLHGGSMTRIGGTPTGLVTHVNSLSISYGGAGTASVSRTTTSNGSSGAPNGRAGYVNLYVNGTFQTSFSTATYSTASALAAAINAYGNNFSATASGSSRLNTTYLSKSSYTPSQVMYPAENFSAGTIQLTEIIDIHADCIVHHTYARDNVNIGFVEINDLIGSAPISQNGDAAFTDVTYRNINIFDTSAANGATAQRGYIASTNAKNCVLKNISCQGTGSGFWFTSPGFDAYSGCVDTYVNYTFWSNSQDTDFKFKGLVIQAGSLPAGASAGNDSKTLSGAAESTFISSSTGRPVTDGDLKLGTNRYAGAKLPTAGSFNYWNVSA